MATQRRGTIGALLIAALAGCGGDDDGKGDDGNRADKPGRPTAATFVGKLPSTEAFVAVEADAPAKGEDKRSVRVYACDARRLCEWYSGSSTGSSFTATSESGGEAEGTLSRKTAEGTIQPADGERLRYRLGRATAAAGVYALDIAENGRLRGASTSGVGLTGKSPLPRPGAGSIKLADGTRPKVDISRKAGGERLALEAGKVRLIVLQNGDLRGAAKSRPDGTEFFVRSSAG
jgi:hypothetical protein